MMQTNSTVTQFPLKDFANTKTKLKNISFLQRFFKRNKVLSEVKRLNKINALKKEKRISRDYFLTISRELEELENANG